MAIRKRSNLPSGAGGRAREQAGRRGTMVRVLGTEVEVLPRKGKFLLSPRGLDSFERIAAGNPKGALECIQRLLRLKQTQGVEGAVHPKNPDGYYPVEKVVERLAKLGLEE